MTRKLPVLLFLLIASSAIAAEPVALSIDGPDTMAPGAARLFTVGGLQSWQKTAIAVLPAKDDTLVVRLRDAEDHPILYVQMGTKNAQVHFVLTDYAGERQAVKSVGNTSPKPDPGPDPKPDPEPKPEPGPLPVAGLHVLIVENPADRAKLPAAQAAALSSQQVRDYLKAKCAKDEAGQPAFRVLAPNADLSKEPKVWQEAMAVKHDGISAPYWIISNGTQGIVAPFPANTAAALETLKKYGG